MAASVEEEEGFVKFPRTPHIAGSAVDGDDDEVVNTHRLGAMAAAWKANSSEHAPLTVCVQEKVDGANVGVSFRGEIDRWAPLCQKRGGLIQPGERHAQYGVFRSWAAEHAEELWALLDGPARVLFGEWLWARHSVAYDRLPGDFFAAFDIFDRATRTFLPHEMVCALAKERFPALRVVPMLWEGSASEAARVCNGDVGGWLRSLIPKRSSYGSEAAEGVYLRVESTTAVVERYKCRRQTFTAGRENFAANVVRNTLI